MLSHKVMSQRTEKLISFWKQPNTLITPSKQLLSSRCSFLEWIKTQLFNQSRTVECWMDNLGPTVGIQKRQVIGLILDPWSQQAEVPLSNILIPKLLLMPCHHCVSAWCAIGADSHCHQCMNVLVNRQMLTGSFKHCEWAAIQEISGCCSTSLACFVPS